MSARADEIALEEKEQEILALRRRLAESEQRASKLSQQLERVTRILDGMAEMVVAKGADGRVVFANKAFADYVGQAPEKGALASTSPNDGGDGEERSAREDRYVFETGQTHLSRDEPIARHDGATLAFDVSRTRVPGTPGEPDMVVAVARGVVRVGDEVVKARSEAHLRVLRRATPDIIFQLDREGTYVDYSAPDDSALAMPPSVFLGKKITDHFPDLAPLFMGGIERALETSEVQTIEYSLLMGGNTSYFEVRMVPAGEAGVYAVVRDISPQKRVEETLRESEDRFRRLVEQSLVGTFMSQGNRFVYVSPRLAEMFGYAQDEILAMSAARDLIAIEDRERARGFFRGLFEPNENKTSPGARFGFRGLRKDGSRLDVEIHAARTILDGKAAIIGTVVDVTEQRRTEEEQRRLQEELLKAQETVLLELSTPLIPISDTVVVMPLVGELDVRRMDRVMERLLGGIGESRARVTILDITGVPSVSREVADALIRTVRAARLLGTEVQITGIRAEVARTLSSLGVDLSGIATLGTLQAGIHRAMRRI